MLVWPEEDIVTLALTDLQKRLCNRLQQGLSLVPQPFAEIAASLEMTEAEVIVEVANLKEAGIIRRISTMVNHRVLGMSSTLVTAHVPSEQLPRVTAAINELPGVSHNYLRQHPFNLWFTLQEKSPSGIEARLRGLQMRFDIEFHSLPVTRVFKLDVRFDAEDHDLVLVHDVENVPATEPVELSDEHRAVLTALQRPLEVTSRPFDAVCPEGMDQEQVFRLLGELVESGAVRRIAAVLNHRKLGFTANVMFAGHVAAEHIVELGEALARFSTVSHCYERKTFPDWPYNLYAMLHGRNMGQVQHTIEALADTGFLQSHQLLPTEAELKKKPVRHELL